MDVISFFSYLEENARKEISAFEQVKGGQPGPRIASLHLIIHHAGILHLESRKHIKLRNRWQISHSWKILSRIGKEVGIFEGLKGDVKLREMLLYFLNSEGLRSN